MEGFEPGENLWGGESGVIPEIDAAFTVNCCVFCKSASRNVIFLHVWCGLIAFRAKYRSKITLAFICPAFELRKM